MPGTIVLVFFVYASGDDDFCEHLVSAYQRAKAAGHIEGGNKDMKAWRRAFLYVTRKTGKMVLLLVLFLTIMTLVLVDTAISQASEEPQPDSGKRLADTLKVATDYQKEDILQTVDQSLIESGDAD